MPDDPTVSVRFLVHDVATDVDSSGSMPHAVADDVAWAGGVGGTRIDLAVAFTDLEGFTAFTAAEGDDVAGRMLLAHHRHADRLARRRGGRVVKRLGDGLLLAFTSPPAAVLTCLELRDTAPLRMRAGVHRGAVNVTSDNDLLGHVVNLASRLAASARPGELLVTDDVRASAAALSCLVFDGPTTRRFTGIDELVPVSATSRTACDWSPKEAAPTTYAPSRPTENT